MSVLDPTNGPPLVPHGGTFSANPMSMSAGIATLEQLTPASSEHLEDLGSRFDAGVHACFERNGVKGQVTGLGSLRRVHLTNEPLSDYRSTVARPKAEARLAVLAKALFEAGVMVANNGLMAFSTPMRSEDADEIIDAFDRVLRSPDFGEELS
jgi:glutamate-1-semialdehyde 2,1-aminomutase